VPTITRAAPAFEGASPEDILAWAIGTFAKRIVLACSFGGPTGMVALDMALRIDAGIPVYYLDTGLLFPQTHALIALVKARYGIEPICIAATTSIADQRNTHGAALWEHDPETCCSIRKVGPHCEFLQRYDAWISGLRRDQSPTRARLPVVQVDPWTGATKVNPLARWDEGEIWRYVRKHKLPYNELHDRGYSSIGCIPCTRAVSRGEHPRAGRWPAFDKLECGLHAAPVDAGGSP
jgi:phosphoadenosine phosphosulfate reductase